MAGEACGLDADEPAVLWAPRLRRRDRRAQLPRGGDRRSVVRACARDPCPEGPQPRRRRGQRREPHHGEPAGRPHAVPALRLLRRPNLRDRWRPAKEADLPVHLPHPAGEQRRLLRRHHPRGEARRHGVRRDRGARPLPRCPRPDPRERPRRHRRLPGRRAGRRARASGQRDRRVGSQDPPHRHPRDQRYDRRGRRQGDHRPDGRPARDGPPPTCHAPREEGPPRAGGDRRGRAARCRSRGLDQPATR